MQEGEREAFRGLLKYAITKDACRRRFLSRHFDGTEVATMFLKVTGPQGQTFSSAIQRVAVILVLFY